MAMTFPSNPTTGQQYSVSGGPTYTWDGTVWKILTPGSQFSEQQFTATAGQTTFTVSGGYVIGAVDVYRNGVKLVGGLDYTATNLSTVVLTNAASAGDTIEVVKAAQILYADALKATNNLSDVGNAATALSNLGGLPKAGGTMTGPLTLGGLLDTGATGQIKFPASQNASSDPNTLDDYEEGTFTPTLGGGANSFTQSGGGFYTKVGNIVQVQIGINWTARSGSDQLTIALPFVSKSGNMYRGAFSVGMITGCSFISSSALTFAQLDTGATWLNLRWSSNGGGWSAFTPGSMGSSGEMQISGSYIIG